MEVLNAAVMKAKKKRQKDKELHLCLNYLVCPQCASKLNTGEFPTFKYECKKCKFSFTSIDEAELHKRLKYAEQN